MAASAAAAALQHMDPSLKKKKTSCPPCVQPGKEGRGGERPQLQNRCQIYVLCFPPNLKKNKHYTCSKFKNVRLNIRYNWDLFSKVTLF